MACAWLSAALGEAPDVPCSLAGRVDSKAWHQVAELARTGIASPLTTSVGRLFDAVAALCGIGAEVSYEGQAAVELEARCDPGELRSYAFPLVDDGRGRLIMDARPTVVEVIDDLEAGTGVPQVAARFHNAVAEAAARACVLSADRAGTENVVLSGGVFQNHRLLERAVDLLAGAGLRVLMPERLQPNDGGIAYGQLAIAAARLAASGGTPDVRV